MNPQQAAAEVAAWNGRYQPGQAVGYRKDSGHVVDAFTATPAALIGAATPIVWLKGMPVFVRLEQVSARSPERCER